jgi:hypothetical protein
MEEHELPPLFKKGEVPHLNNIELGKRAVGAQTYGAILAHPQHRLRTCRAIFDPGKNHVELRRFHSISACLERTLAV